MIIVADLPGVASNGKLQLLIKSSSKSFVVFCDDMGEKLGWLNAFQDCIDLVRKTIQFSTYSKSVAVLAQDGSAARCVLVYCLV